MTVLVFFLEVGPHPALIAMGRLCLPTQGCIWFPSLRSDRSARQQMLDSLGGLYCAGAKPNLASTTPR